MQTAANPHTIPDLLKSSGRDRPRREAVRATIAEYFDAAETFEHGKPTSKHWAALVQASRQLHALLKAQQRRRSEKPSLGDDTFARVLALGGLADRLR